MATEVVDVLIVRNADGDDVGEIIDYQRLRYREALNRPGGWQLTVNATNPVVDELRTVGAGLAVIDDITGAVEFSGPVAPSGSGVSADRVTTQTVDEVTFTGPDDLGVLWWRRAIPPAGESHLEASGLFGVAAADIVATQLAEHADTDRRLNTWRTVSADIGDTVTISGRYQPVGDLLAAAAGNTVMRARWRRSGIIVFTVNELAANQAPLSVADQTVQRVEIYDTAAEASTVYGLGQGEGADRTVAVAGTATGWSRIETVLDRRDLSTADGLAAAAAAAVKPGRQNMSVPLIDDYGLSVGDTVTVDLYGVETVLPVADRTVTITPEGTTIEVTVGDPTETELDRIIAAARRPVSAQP